MSEEFNELKFSESQISLGKKTDLRQKEKTVKPQKKEKPETTKINLQPKKRKRRKKYTDAIELEESDSKEYIEEEEEEEDDGLSVEIKNSDNDEESSESQESQIKKRKLEEINPGPRWERTYKDNTNENNNNNDSKSASSLSAVSVNIEKPNKNNNQNNEYNSTNNNIEDANLMNKNKNDIQVNYVGNLPENVNINNNNNSKMFITNINNQNKSDSYKNFYQNSLKNLNHQNLGSKQNIDNSQNKKPTNNNIYNNNNKPQTNQEDQNKLNYFQQKPFLVKYQKLLFTQRIDQFIDARYREYKFNKDDERLYQVLYENLYNYLRIYLLRLIKISRIRNVSFQLYSNNQNGQILYKFRTYNSQISEDRKSINYTKSGNFDILFTSNYKKDMDLIDEYVELNNKKLKFEKLSSCKEKDEENDKVKGLETSIKITEGPNPTIKLLPGRRTKKKDNSFIKEVRKKIVQTQKKEDLLKQNSNTKNTLEAFMNESNFSFKNKTKGKINSLLDDNKLNNKMDISSRMSDNLSNMYSYTNNTYNQIKNEIDMNVYKYFDPTKNENIPRPQKRRIILKDFIFMIENSNEYIPNKMFLLNKASLEFVKKK